MNDLTVEEIVRAAEQEGFPVAPSEGRAIFTFQDSLGHQVLVECWNDGVVTCATRNSERSVWGVPLTLVRREVVS